MAYFPNGASAQIFEDQCTLCVMGEAACPVALVQLYYNYEQLAEGQEKLRAALRSLVTDEGACQVFALLREVDADGPA